jgi:hypothetical protein
MTSIRVRVKDRGRDLVVHQAESQEEAHELRRVYLLLGYPEERILVETEPAEDRPAA